MYYMSCISMGDSLTWVTINDDKLYEKIKKTLIKRKIFFMNLKHTIEIFLALIRKSSDHKFSNVHKHDTK